MKKLRNFLWIILLISLIITVLLYFIPDASKRVSDYVNITDNQLNICLTFLDILVSAILTIWTELDQKKAEKQCTYNFEIEKDNLSLQNYKRIPDETNSTYKYFCQRKVEDTDSPYYAMDIRMVENALCSVGIPLCMTVSTGLSGNKIKFTKLKVFIKKKNLLKYTLEKGIIIEKPIENGKKFLIRIRLLCDHNLEKSLLNSHIYVCFKIELEDDKQRSHRKYIILEILNTLGGPEILSICSKNNRFAYTREIRKLND